MNGWKNRETWLVNLWFSPQSVSELEFIKEQLEEEIEKLSPFMRDFVDYSAIDWRELRETLEENEATEGEGDED